MEELQNTNPAMDNPDLNPVAPEDTNSNVQNPVTEQQQSTDYSQLFSENISENNSAENLQNQNEPVAPVETIPQPETPNVSEPVKPSVQETRDQALEPNFQKELENTSLDNSQNIQTAQQVAEQKARIEQQKLAWLKEHESKAKKSWLATWILSGILITLLLFIAGVIFAKDYVLNAIDYIDSLLPTSSRNITNNNQNNYPINPIIDNSEITENALSWDIEELDMHEEEATDETDKTSISYDKVDEIISSEDDLDSKVEQLKNMVTQIIQENEEPDEELTQYISQAIMDLTINSEEPQTEENNEEVVSNENVSNENVNEEVDNSESNEIVEEENNDPYTITHVNSEAEANWVLPSHCSDLTCYGEDQEFVECTSFRLIETLDENTPRVSSRWGCKYKDVSELVYVEFNNNHNSAEDTQSDYSAATESEPILEMDESANA